MKDCAAAPLHPSSLNLHPYLMTLQQAFDLACQHHHAGQLHEAELLYRQILSKEPEHVQALHHLRHRGNEVMLFQVLDEAEVHFPFEGLIEFEDVETPDRLTIDARGMRDDYLTAIRGFQERYRSCRGCVSGFAP